MTDREAFEAWSTEWIEQDCPSIKTDLLERKGDTYANAMQRVKWKTWQAALATAPAWHPAPTVPGTWILSLDSGMEVQENITQHEIDIEATWPGGRWYGPIPQEPAP